MGIILCCLDSNQKNLLSNICIKKNIELNRRLNLYKEKVDCFDYTLQYIASNDSNDENTLIISCSSNIDGENSVFLLDYNFERKKKLENPHKQRITSVTTFPSNLNIPFVKTPLFVTGDLIGNIKIWDKNLEKVTELNEHKKSIIQLDVIRKPLRFVSLSSDKLILWSLIYQGELIFKKRRFIEESDLRNFCIIPYKPNETFIAVCHSFCNLIIYDTKLNELYGVRNAHLKMIMGLKYIKNLYDTFIVSISQDGVLKIWDIKLNVIKERKHSHKDPWGLESLNYKVEENGLSIGLFATYGINGIKIWDYDLHCIKEINNIEVSYLNSCQIENKIYLTAATQSQKFLIFD